MASTRKVCIKNQKNIYMYSYGTVWDHYLGQSFIFSLSDHVFQKFIMYKGSPHLNMNSKFLLKHKDLEEL